MATSQADHSVIGGRVRARPVLTGKIGIVRRLSLAFASDVAVEMQFVALSTLGTGQVVQAILATYAANGFEEDWLVIWAFQGWSLDRVIRLLQCSEVVRIVLQVVVGLLDGSCIADQL